MTISEAINKIDALKPNTYTENDKIKWLSTLDGIIKKEIIDTHDDKEGIVFNGYDYDTSTKTKLLVDAPHDDIYIRWLEAQIDYANGEYGKYSNAMAMFNSAYGIFERFYNRNHTPKGTKFKYF